MMSIDVHVCIITLVSSAFMMWFAIPPHIHTQGFIEKKNLKGGGGGGGGGVQNQCLICFRGGN